MRQHFPVDFYGESKFLVSIQIYNKNYTIKNSQDIIQITVLCCNPLLKACAESSLIRFSLIYNDVNVYMCKEKTKFYESSQYMLILTMLFRNAESTVCIFISLIFSLEIYKSLCF